jgi:hypothetical protein
MTDSGDLALVRRPTRTQLAAASAALRAQREAGHYVCGCFVALCRDPFAPGLIGHWRTYHPNSLALLENAQADRRENSPTRRNDRPA